LEQSKKWFENLQSRLVDKEVKDVQHIFYESAKDLMNNFVLKIDSLEIELTEIEFYYFECQYHADLYVHLDKLQKETSGYLYVHKKAEGRGGIDLTFGNNRFFGGILLRGIKDSDAFVSGPSKVKEYISEKLKIEDKNHKELQEFFGKLRGQDKIYLQKRDESKEKYDLLHSIRVGLNAEVDETFCKALYRFVRLDYLEAKKDENFTTYNNLKDRSKLKAISYLTKVCDKFANEKAMMKQIENDKLLRNYIKGWNQNSNL
jgi:hypothetical protein